MRLSRPLIAAATLTGLLPAQHTLPDAAPFTPEIRAASDAAARALRTFSFAPGFSGSLVAAEPDLANPIAFDIDPEGRFWIAECYRLRRGVYDTREHRDWLIDDLAARTVADRSADMKRWLADSMPEQTAAHDLIRLLQDSDGDGRLESSVFADGFNALEDGLAAGVLKQPNGDVWLTDIPSLWRLRDEDGDGKADTREAVHTGFGVRFNLIGHDMHGLRVGPDQRLYFSIGDRGFHVESDTGATLAHPDEGAVLRCELDGSGLEVFAHGLRNPQELAFDAHGNLFTGDNNSDGGDRARWVYLVQGGDSGWRVGYQWLNDRGPWNREKLWHPHHPGQPAWIVPPVANVAYGPSGVTYNPGGVLPARYDNCFLLCDYRATPAVSGVHAVSTKPFGAGFELDRFEKFAWGICATDVEFGYDGGTYLLDWVEGWGQPMRGRIYRVQHDETASLPSATAAGARLREGLDTADTTELCGLLQHSDMRLRLAAQFALVDRDAADALADVANAADHQLARLHAIWGIGCIARRDKPETCASIVGLLGDGDPEVVAQTAKVCGEAKYKKASSTLRQRLNHHSARVRAFAATALGALRSADGGATIDALAELLRRNADRDPWLRHAAVHALARIGDTGALRARALDEDPAVRRGMLLAFAAMGDDDCAMFLNDPDPSVRLESARATYRNARGFTILNPMLAELILRPDFGSHELSLRVLNANRRLASRNAARHLATYALRSSASEDLRIEALEILGEWHDPSPLDRVIGGWRPVMGPKDNNPLAAMPGMRVDRRAGDARLAEILPRLLSSERGTLATTAARIAGARKLSSCEKALAKAAGDNKRDDATRAAALQALASMDSKRLDSILDSITAADPVAMRLATVRLLAQRRPEATVPLLESLCQSGNRRERQNAMKALAASPSAAADAAVRRLAQQFSGGDLPDDLGVEVIEAWNQRFDSKNAKHMAMTDLNVSDQRDDGIPDGATALRAALVGGDAKAGRRIALQHPSAQCIRCHVIEHQGGAAGPALDGIGKRADRGYILESLLSPSAKIAEGYALATIEMKDGSSHAGVIVEDSAERLELAPPTGGDTRISLNPTQVKSRSSQSVSTMPPMGGILSLRELRDLVEFLATRK